MITKRLLLIVLCSISLLVTIFAIAGARWERANAAAANATATAAATRTPIGAAPARTPAPLPTPVPGGAITGTLPPFPFPSVVDPGPTGPPAPRQPNDFTGMPTIFPRIPNSDPAMPTFTAQDAANDALAHPPPQAHGTPITIVKVTFATHQQLVAQGAGDLGVSPTRLLCYVQMSGTFTVSAPPPGHAATKHTAYFYYDAHTGNYLGLAITE